jgi:Lon protease-like protein
MSDLELAMFPLEVALLPDQELPLRIFEPRYVALVRHCVDEGDPFGVVLISRGREVGGGESRCDVGVLSRIVECIDQGADRYSLACRTGERIRVSEWLPDDPYPRAMVRLWPDEPGDPVTPDQLRGVEDRVIALFERIAEARGAQLPDRDILLGYGEAGAEDAGQRLFALASRIPLGAADKYSVLSAPSAAERLAVLDEAVVAVAEMVEFQLSSRGSDE